MISLPPCGLNCQLQPLVGHLLCVAISGGAVLLLLFAYRARRTPLLMIVAALGLACSGIGPAGEGLFDGLSHAEAQPVRLSAQQAVVAADVTHPDLAEFVRRAESVYRSWGLGAAGKRGECWSAPWSAWGSNWNRWLADCHPTLSGRSAADPVQDWRRWSYSGQLHLVIPGDVARCLSESAQLRPYVTPHVDPRLYYPPEARIGSAGLVAANVAALESLCKSALAPTGGGGSLPGQDACSAAGWSSSPVLKTTCRYTYAADGSGCCWRDSIAGRICRTNHGCILDAFEPVICPDGTCSPEERADGSCPADCPVTEPPEPPEPPVDDCDAEIDRLFELLAELDAAAERVRECRRDE